ncbi:unnamed protein product [Caenorhabditis nigoni]
MPMDSVVLVTRGTPGIFSHAQNPNCRNRCCQNEDEQVPTPTHKQANDWNQPTTQTRPNQRTHHTNKYPISFSRMEEPLLCGEDPRYPPDGNPRGVDHGTDRR